MIRRKKCFFAVKTTIQRLISILTKKEKAQLVILLIAVGILSLVELVGVGSVLPFIHLLSGEETLDSFPVLPEIMERWGIDDTNRMKWFMGIAVLGFITISNLLHVLIFWFRQRFSWGLAKELSLRLLKNHLGRPYSFFVTERSATIRSKILNEVNNITSAVFMPLLDLVSKSILIIVIVILLFFVAPTITGITLGVLLLAYGVIFLSLRKFIHRLGKIRVEKNRMRFRLLSEILGGIKTIKIFNAQEKPYREFKTISETFFSIQPRVNTLSHSPRYIFEILAFGAIILIALYLSNNASTSAIPMLALFAVAGYRLMPSIQAVFAALTTIRHSWPLFEKLYPDLALALQETEMVHNNGSIDPMVFKNSIKFENLHFQHDKQKLFNDLNFEIKKGQMISIMGITGGGKTTALDLIAGLIFPDSGTIKIDSTALNRQNAVQWRKQIAYVTQDDFLFDDSILANIVLDDSAIDMQRVNTVCRQAALLPFIEQQANGLQAIVGERGVQISGGQKQRIAIARALYRQADVLILDEATSALDSITEQNILDTLLEEYKALTIICVTHRIASLRMSDHIYIIENGKLVTEGVYDELVTDNIDFQRYLK